LTETQYWNHNSAYHPWIVRLAAQRGGHALDVGCGEGLLVQRLATVSKWVTGIDPDPSAIARARRRNTGLTNVTLEAVAFTDYEANEGSFDVVTFVASLHHLDLTAALLKARSLLSPGGELIVVGLAANKTAIDWIMSGLILPFVRLGSWMITRHEMSELPQRMHERASVRFAPPYSASCRGHRFGGPSTTATCCVGGSLAYSACRPVDLSGGNYRCQVFPPKWAGL